MVFQGAGLRCLKTKLQYIDFHRFSEQEYLNGLHDEYAQACHVQVMQAQRTLKRKSVPRWRAILGLAGASVSGLLVGFLLGGLSP